MGQSRSNTETRCRWSSSPTLTWRVVVNSSACSSMLATSISRTSALASVSGRSTSPTLPLALCQSSTGMAIVRFVARKVGMAGNTDMEFFKADMVACHFEDIFTKLPGLRFAKTQEDRVTKAKEMMEDFLPKWLAPLETLLKKRGGEWYSGSGPTFADLAMMVALDFMHAPEEMAFKDMDNLKERRALLDKFPLVKGNYQ